MLSATVIVCLLVVALLLTLEYRIHLDGIASGAITILAIRPLVAIAVAYATMGNK